MSKITSFTSSDRPTNHTQIKGDTNESSEHFDLEDSFTDSFYGSTAEGHESILIQKVPYLECLLGQSSPSPEDFESLLLKSVNEGDLDSCKDILSRHRVEITQKFEDRNTLLHIAAGRGYLKICEVLLDYGKLADINSLNKNLDSPLHVACSAGFLQVTQLLVRSGSEINRKNLDGNTPLHLACLNGNAELVNWLLSRNPNLELMNLKGVRAEELGADAIQKLFLKYSKRTIINSGPSLNPCHKKAMSKVPSAAVRIQTSNFEVLKELGKGSFGEVFLVRKQDTGALYAMKVLQKEKMISQNLIKYALTERNVLTYLSHPFIVSLKFAFQTNEKLFLVLDFCPGGDLGHHLSSEKRFTEYRARIYLCEIILALEELHKRNIIFRDLKPDNIVIDNDGHALLTDFGLSKEHVIDNQQARSFCGSLAYLAPEVIRRQGHGKAVDWYLLGVVFYEMVVGKPPYFSMDKKELLQNIQKGKLKIPASLSSEAKELIIDVCGM